MRNVDVAIVGGGLAGSTAAAMLARAGRDFVIVDPDKTYPWDFRVEKLDPSQLFLLRKTGLAGTVLPSATPVDQTWIARFERFVQKRPTEQFGFYYDGFVNRFRAEIPPEQFVVGKVASIATSPDRQALALSNGEEISARLVVLATGPNNALRKSIGIERKVLTACQSVSIGFDMKPVGRAKFDFPAMTCFPDRLSDPIAYLTLFPIGPVMRANLFIYRDFRDAWLEQFRRAPIATILAAMPGLRTLLGAFEIVGAVKIRPIDLYATTGYRQAGVVLVGDAFSSSCPAAGNGASKVLMDVERLCNLYIPRWLASGGMGQEKIDAFYSDPDKRACDASSTAQAHLMRSLSTDRSLHWRIRRLFARFKRIGRVALELAKGAIISLSPAPKEPTPKQGG